MGAVALLLAVLPLMGCVGFGGTQAERDLAVRQTQRGVKAIAAMAADESVDELQPYLELVSPVLEAYAAGKSQAEFDYAAAFEEIRDAEPEIRKLLATEGVSYGRIEAAIQLLWMGLDQIEFWAVQSQSRTSDQEPASPPQGPDTP